MSRNVIVAGLIGAAALAVWTILVNGLLGFRSRLDMKQVPNERAVYDVLKENITDPGRYSCNPPVTDAHVFPAGEPVFSILYGGVGHEAAGRLAVKDLALALLVPLGGAWMLSLASRRVLASYARRVGFLAGIGVLVALYSDLSHVGIGSYPVGDALLLAAHSMVTWTVVGLAVAWRMGPRGDARAS
jgi:hypothetical protein